MDLPSRDREGAKPEAPIVTAELAMTEAIPPARIPTKAEETRARILAGALSLFRRKGYAETTMREIASEAGVALGSAYYYFASKEALVMAFYEQCKEELGGPIQEAMKGKKDLGSRVRAILETKFRYFTPNRLFLGP